MRHKMILERTDDDKIKLSVWCMPDDSMQIYESDSSYENPILELICDTPIAKDNLAIYPLTDIIISSVNRSLKKAGLVLE